MVQKLPNLEREVVLRKGTLALYTGESTMATSSQQQTIPVQVHKAADLIVLAAPMPGLEPEDISVYISGERVTIRGDYRGSRQDQPEVLISEWTIGPYYREV